MVTENRSLVRHFTRAASFTILFALLFTFFFTFPAFAQPQVPEAPATKQFLPRFDFHLAANRFNVDDEQFSWDTHWGGELDIVDYVSGRLTLGADYEAVLGDEFQPFDPNQGIYSLDVKGSMRLEVAELQLFFHHVSKHFGDRRKEFGIAWNVAGARLLKDVSVGPALVNLRADAGIVTQRAQVDYDWTAGGGVGAFLPTSTHVAWYGRAQGELTGVEEHVANRGMQKSGRIEGGIHLSGTGGAVELFAGYERVIDANPLDRQPRHWSFLGFRLVGR